MDYIKFDYRTPAIDELYAGACVECGALVHRDDQDRHLDWHRSLEDFQRDIYHGAGQ